MYIRIYYTDNMQTTLYVVHSSKLSCCYHTLSLLVCAGSGSDGQTTTEDRHHQLGKSGPHTKSVDDIQIIIVYLGIPIQILTTFSP